MGPESATRTCTAPVRAGWVPVDGFAERMIFTPSLCPKGDGPDVCVITPVCDEFDAQYLLSQAYCCAQFLWQYSPSLVGLGTRRYLRANSSKARVAYFAVQSNGESGDECVYQTCRFGGCGYAHPAASRGHLRSGDCTVACFGSCILCFAKRQSGGGGELAEPGPVGRGRFRQRSDHTTRKSGWHGRSCIRRGTPSALSAFKIGHSGRKFHLFSRLQSEFDGAARWLRGIERCGHAVGGRTHDPADATGCCLCLPQFSARA